ncbi:MULTISPECIES: hypothetical protein [unclassified Streptomyces]|uniref:hypothetical protein n=1 Tax=unclassified Streptomyces TaxID=2593676 RepID=UPI0029675F56|nr:hypothetical protein [Streptomyces sp. SJL17-1]
MPPPQPYIAGAWFMRETTWYDVFKLEIPNAPDGNGNFTGTAVLKVFGTIHNLGVAGTVSGGNVDFKIDWGTQGDPNADRKYVGYFGPSGSWAGNSFAWSSELHGGPPGQWNIWHQ